MRLADIACEGASAPALRYVCRDLRRSDGPDPIDAVMHVIRHALGMSWRRLPSEFTWMHWAQGALWSHDAIVYCGAQVDGCCLYGCGAALRAAEEPGFWRSDHVRKQTTNMRARLL